MLVEGNGGGIPNGDGLLVKAPPRKVVDALQLLRIGAFVRVADSRQQLEEHAVNRRVRLRELVPQIGKRLNGFAPPCAHDV